MNKVFRYFANADLRCMHDGLADICKKNGIDVTKLKRGEFVFFANSRFDRLKIYCANNVICYVKAPHGRLSADAIKYLPLTFNGSEFNYNSAVSKALGARGLRMAA